MPTANNQDGAANTFEQYRALMGAGTCTAPAMMSRWRKRNRKEPKGDDKQQEPKGDDEQQEQKGDDDKQQWPAGIWVCPGCSLEWDMGTLTCSVCVKRGSPEGRHSASLFRSYQ